jgi:hypothetical protein
MISLLIVVPEILDVLTGEVGRSVPVANKVTLPPTRSCGPYDSGQAPHYPLFLPFEDLTYYPYQHLDLYDYSDRCTFELLDIEALSVYIEGRKHTESRMAHHTPTER